MPQAHAFRLGPANHLTRHMKLLLLRLPLLLPLPSSQQLTAASSDCSPSQSIPCAAHLLLLLSVVRPSLRWSSPGT
jgi:hypothetical protein